MIVTKLDAARRQLHAAINLFFRDLEPISVHLLGATAATLLGDLNEMHYNTSWRKEWQQFYPHMTGGEFLSILRRAQNFFKHADRDALDTLEDTLEFDDELNDSILFLAALEYHNIQGHFTPTVETFWIWYIATRPDTFGSEFLPSHRERFLNILPGINMEERLTQKRRGLQLLISHVGAATESFSHSQ